MAILDLRMPVMDGVACVRALTQAHPDLPILMLTTYEDDRLIRDCLLAGATAYLLKDIEPEDLANAIRLVVAGGSLIPGDLARRVTLGPDPAVEPLTPQQQEILALIAQGLSNREIAARLFLTEGTVKNVVSEMHARLNVRDRVQAVLRSRQTLRDEP